MQYLHRDGATAKTMATRRLRKPTKSEMKACIIIINWNRIRDAEKAIESVLNNTPQSYPYELILWDNGSKDGSPEYLTRRFSEHPQVRIIDSGHNDGVCVGRNKAVALTHAPILVFMDSDSLLQTPNPLALVESFFANDPNTALVSFRILNNQGNLLWAERRPVEQWRDHIYEIARADGCGFAVKKEVFDQAGGFPEHFGYGSEDHYLARRCIALGYDVKYFPHVTVQHMESPGGRNPDAFVTMMRNKIWMALELYPFPYCLVSAVHMTLVHFGEARERKLVKYYPRGLLAGWLGFRFSRRRPFTRANWRRYRAIVNTDAELAKKK